VILFAVILSGYCGFTLILKTGRGMFCVRCSFVRGASYRVIKKSGSFLEVIEPRDIAQVIVFLMHHTILKA
jgi:hypothetical protein